MLFFKFISDIHATCKHINICWFWTSSYIWIRFVSLEYRTLEWLIFFLIETMACFENNSYCLFFMLINTIIELVKLNRLVIVRISGSATCTYHLWNKTLDNFFLKPFRFMFLSGTNTTKSNSWSAECSQGQMIICVKLLARRTVLVDTRGPIWMQSRKLPFEDW